jgi:hypothetical protein
LASGHPSRYSMRSLNRRASNVNPSPGFRRDDSCWVGTSTFPSTNEYPKLEILVAQAAPPE